jgi:hypothetical protein
VDILWKVTRSERGNVKSDTENLCVSVSFTLYFVCTGLLLPVEEQSAVASVAVPR